MSLRPLIHTRSLYNPPRKSFYSCKNALSNFWLNKVLVNLKYGMGLVGTGLTLANVHPNVLFTLLPPVGVAGYFTYRKMVDKLYKSESGVIAPASLEELHQQTIEIPKYDASDLKTVLDGIENEFDFFKAQIYKVVDTKIKDTVTPDDEMFVQDNKILFKLGDIENFIVLKLKVEFEGFNQKLDFIKFAMPVLNGKARKGIVEVYLLKLPEETETEEKVAKDVYRFKMVTSPYKLL